MQSVEYRVSEHAYSPETRKTGSIVGQIKTVPALDQIEPGGTDNPYPDAIKPVYPELWLIGGAVGKGVISIGGRALKYFQQSLISTASKKYLDEMVKTSEAAAKTKGRSSIFKRQGGIEQAKNDFDNLKPQNVRVDKNGTRYGELSNGDKINIRTKEWNGETTIEIQKASKKIKFRYTEN